MGLKFEEMESVLLRVAYRLVPPEMDVWELVNETWLIGRVQQATNIKEVWRIATFDMIDHLRKKLGRKGGYSYKKSNGEKISCVALKKRVRFNSIHQVVKISGKKKMELMDVLQNKVVNTEEGIDNQDELVTILKGLDRRDKMIIKMRLEGFSFGDIGKATGYCESTICLRSHALGRMLYPKLERLKIVRAS